LIDENKRLKAENEELRGKYESLLEKSLKEKENLSVKLQDLENANLVLRDDQRRLQKENIELKEDQRRLQKENIELKEENTKLKERIKNLEEELQRIKREQEVQSKRLSDLLATQKRTEAKFLASDLARLFIFYFVEPSFQKGRLWRDFANELAEKKADVEEGKFEQSEFYTWLLQQPESQNLLKLQELMADRHEVSYTDLRSSISQDNFLRFVIEFNWKEYFPDYALLVTEMISRLKDVKKKRMK